MKICYILLIIASLMLIVFGGLCIGMLIVHNANGKTTSLLFAGASTIFEIFAIFVGLLGIKKKSRIPSILLITSIPMLIWSGLIFLSPINISIDEVFLFWLIYCIALIWLSILGFRDKPKKEIEQWDESILDDLV